MSIWRTIFKKNCTIEEAHFLITAAYGRDAEYDAEIDTFMGQSFFGGLKRVISSPFYLRTVIEPCILGKHPLVLQFHESEQQRFGRVLETQFKETIVPKSWRSLTRTLLSTPRFRKAFLEYYDQESLDFVAEFYGTPRPQLNQQFGAVVTQSGLNRISIHIGAEAGLPESLSAYVNGKPAGVVPVDASIGKTTDIDYLIDFTTVLPPQESGELSLYAEPSGQLLCPPAIVKNTALNAEPEYPKTIRVADYGKNAALFTPDKPSIYGDLPKLLFLVSGTEVDAAVFKKRLTPTLKSLSTVMTSDRIGRQTEVFSQYDFVVPASNEARISGYLAHWLSWATKTLGNLPLMRFGYDHFIRAGEKFEPIFPCRFDPLKTDGHQSIGMAISGAFFGAWVRETKARGFAPEDMTKLASTAYNHNGSRPVKDFIPEILMSIPKGKALESSHACKTAPTNSVDAAPSTISVIIPTKDRADLIQPCVKSLQKTAAYGKNINVIIVDNGSTDAAFLDWKKSCDNNGNILFVRDDRRFNWSALNNLGASQAEGDILLFLNDDTKANCTGWDESVVRLLTETDIGAVGAKLLFPDNRLQHAGILLTPDLEVIHEGKGLPENAKGYDNRYFGARTCDAVTGAFIACRRTDFEAIGGFDENLAITFNDIDLCMRLQRRNLDTVYEPSICFYHLESESRGADEDSEEKTKRKAHDHEYFRERHEEFMQKRSEKFGDIVSDAFDMSAASDFTILRFPGPKA